ncbi:hypothetical protein BUALT_Bualt03G0141300 [Buddleja alternifolia]|uniref:Uncharacterized protein n=1 Tax=Buddleja alternifolia TaxID=168488 RepID=A0AAV6Y4H0_9LAMI|nr:hypothetical protein BUALT_Bualt03G0141300 [Buddleja alternifolia]
MHSPFGSTKNGANMEERILRFCFSPKWFNNHAWIPSVPSPEMPQSSSLNSHRLRKLSQKGLGRKNLADAFSFAKRSDYVGVPELQVLTITIPDDLCMLDTTWSHHPYGCDCPRHPMKNLVELISDKHLQVEPKERGLGIAVISSNLSAATSLASVSLALSSLIGAWIGSSYHNDSITNSIYGNTSATIVYLKYVTLLSCFLIAFACFVQTARCLVHANFLISMPNCKMPVSSVESAVIKGSNFWVIGLRSLYFATNLLLWIFGPIPMFVCSVVMVVLLQYLDKNATPLLQYDPPVSYETYKKIDKEMTAVTGTTDEHESSQNGRNGTSNAQQ